MHSNVSLPSGFVWPSTEPSGMLLLISQ